MLVKINSVENIEPQGQRRANGILQLKYCVRGGGAGSKTRSSLLAGLSHMCQVRGLCPREAEVQVGGLARSGGQHSLTHRDSTLDLS